MEKSRIKDLFSKDKFLRFLSLIIAVMLWAYVSYVLNPETQKQITSIPVNFINEQALLNSGLVLNDKEYSVDVVVNGRRNVLSSLNNDRVSAEIDLSRYLKPGTNRVNVKMEGIPASVEIVKDPQDVFIELSKAHFVEKKITVSIVGEQSQGFVIKEPIVKPEMVTIQGEREIIDSIHDVTVIVDISNLQNTVISKQNLNIIDKRGNEIRDVKTNVEMVEVKIPIQKEKQVKIESSRENDG